MNARARIAAVGAAVLFSAFGVLAPAGAATPITATDGPGLAAAVFGSADPQAAYASLTPAQQTTLQNYETPGATLTRTTNVTPAPPEVTGGKVVATCWTGIATFEKENLVGKTIYTWWQTLRWCTKNHISVSSYVVLDQGGETSTPGWSYGGHGLSGKLISGNQARSYTTEKFNFNVLWTSFSNTVCAQIRASGNGSVTYMDSCNLS